MSRVSSKFEKNGLPDPYFGPLRTAKVVLLFLSPGWQDGLDGKIDASASGREYCLRQLRGDAALPTFEEHATASKWAARIINQFGVAYDLARNDIAFLNIGAYKSATFHDWGMLAALPSARAALGWAQDFLFPAAEAGERTVICLRSSRYWGLGDDVEGHQYGASLFAPPRTRGGFIRKSAMRSMLEERVQTLCRANRTTIREKRV